MLRLSNYGADEKMVTRVFLVLLLLPFNAFALTKYDLMGDWTMTEFRNTYPAYNITINETDLVGFSGRASLSGKAGTLEMSGTYQGEYNWRWATGFYTVSGSQATFSIVGEGSETITLQKPSEDTLVATGASYDIWGDYYTYRYVFVRTNRYYEEAQVQPLIDAAVQDATNGLFTQAEVDAAVADALSGVKPKVVPIIMVD
jgi:hypothetical protein